MASKQVPWWADPNLTPEQKQIRADGIAEVLTNAWLGLPTPTRRDVELARFVARNLVAAGINPHAK